MGARSIRMPDVGEGVAEAEIVEWSVKVGDLVREDQVVAAVMTDKATVEIPTPVAGTVVALGGGVGDVLAVGAELIRIEAPGLPDSPPPPPPKGVAKAAAAAKLPRPPSLRPAPAEPVAEASAPAPAPAPPAPRASPPQPHRGAPRPAGEKPLASPAVRQRAREAGVDLRFVHGSGPAGRITHDDLDAFLARPPEAPAKAPGRQPNLAVETIKVVGMRRRIAQNMAESARRVAHFSYVEEVDVTALEELRAALNARATEERPKLTMLPFLMLAVVKAVADFPAGQRPLRRRQRGHHPLRRGPSRHCDPDAGRADGSGRPPRRDARPARGGARDAARQRGGTAGRRAARGADRLDDHADLARRARRNRLDPDRQPAGSGDRRGQQDRGQAGVARRRLRAAEDA